MALQEQHLTLRSPPEGVFDAHTDLELLGHRGPHREEGVALEEPLLRRGVLELVPHPPADADKPG